MAVSREDAERLALAQTGIRLLVEGELADFFGALDLSAPERARDALLEFTPVLVEEYGEMAAAVAADWYDDVRATERIPGSFRAEMVVPDEAIAIEKTVRRAAGALFTDTPADTLTGISSKAGKYTLSASRNTVMRSSFEDPYGRGYQRVARGATCRFCLMLVGRGAVYSRDTAFFAAHGHCDCAAVPSWDPTAPEVEADLYVASRRTTFMSPAQKAQHNALIRRAMDEYVPE